MEKGKEVVKVTGENVMNMRAEELVHLVHDKSIGAEFNDESLECLRTRITISRTHLMGPSEDGKQKYQTVIRVPSVWHTDTAALAFEWTRDIKTQAIEFLNQPYPAKQVSDSFKYERMN